MIRNQSIKLNREKELAADVKDKVLSFPIVMLALVITSTFYVVPLARLDTFGTDMRLFDFVFAFFFLTVGLQAWPSVIGLIKTKNRLFWWSGMLLILVWLSMVVTVSTGGLGRLMPAIIRSIRFSAFILLGAYVVVFVDSKAKFKLILGVVFVNILVQALLSAAQRLGWVGTFYPGHILQMYGFHPVGTLSAHHKHIGVVMMLGLGVSLTLLRTIRNLLVRFLIVFAAGAMIAASVFAVSRTAWLGIGGIVLGYFLIHKTKSIGIIILVIVGLLIGLFAVDSLGFDVISVLEDDFNRVFTDRIQRAGFEGVAGPRLQIYETVPNRIRRNPWILIIGTGFQNQSSFFFGSGAHNNFMHVWMELGVIGFFVYLGLLFQILRDLRAASKKLNDPLEQTLAQDTFAVFIGIILTMIVGETFWAQPAMQTMSAQIMILVGLAVAPFYCTQDNEKDVESANRPITFTPSKDLLPRKQ